MDITLERILPLIPSEKDGRFKKYAAADFASKIGVAQNLPSEWKAGRNKSYKTKLQTIADAYNVSIDWLYGKTDIKEKPPAEAGDIRKQAEEIIARMDQDQLLEFISMATEKLRQK